MSNGSNPLKPAPLSFSSSGRASPFRRPESPLGRSPSTVRGVTPGGSPLKQSNSNPLVSNLSPSASQTPLRPFSPGSAEDKSWLTTRGTTTTPTQYSSPTKSSNPASSGMGGLGAPLASSTNSLSAAKSTFDSPTATTPTATRPSHIRSATAMPAPTARNSDPLSSIPPQHLHTMRESFAVLDRSNTGVVTPADVSQQLAELGLDSSSSALNAYFSPGSSQSINLATYLNLLSSDLANLSRQEELMAAFSAFDEDDSGQIDVVELRDAVMHTMPEPGSGDRQLTEREVDRIMDGFIGRRAFKKGQVGNTGGLGGKKDVFRYGDFVTGIWGGNEEARAQKIDA